MHFKYFEVEWKTNNNVRMDLDVSLLTKTQFCNVEFLKL